MNIRINISKRMFVPSDIEIEIEGISEEKSQNLVEEITKSIVPLVNIINTPDSEG